MADLNDPVVVALLAHRSQSHAKKGSKIVCMTRADEQLAIQQVQAREERHAELAPAPAANSRERRQQQRGAAPAARALPLAEPLPQTLGGPAKELPESVLKKMSVAYVVRDGERRSVLLRSLSYKGVYVDRLVVPIEDMPAAMDIQYTNNSGKKSGQNNLEYRVSRAGGQAGAGAGRGHMRGCCRSAERLYTLPAIHPPSQL